MKITAAQRQTLEGLAAQFMALAAPLAREAETPNGKGWLRLCDLLEAAARDPLIAESPGASDLVAVVLLCAEDAIRAKNSTDALRELDGLLPLGELGAKFRAGRKRPGPATPLRAAIARVLDREPSATNDAIWMAIKARPPKALRLYETKRLGRYLETDGAADTGWPRFCNIASEERKGR